MRFPFFGSSGDFAVDNLRCRGDKYLRLHNTLWQDKHQQLYDLITLETTFPL